MGAAGRAALLSLHLSVAVLGNVQVRLAAVFGFNQVVAVNGGGHGNLHACGCAGVCEMQSL